MPGARAVSSEGAPDGSPEGAGALSGSGAVGCTGPSFLWGLSDRIPGGRRPGLLGAVGPDSWGCRACPPAGAGARLLGSCRGRGHLRRFPSGRDVLVGFGGFDGFGGGDGASFLAVLLRSGFGPRGFLLDSRPVTTGFPRGFRAPRGGGARTAFRPGGRSGPGGHGGAADEASFRPWG
ncbi:hypothetical protein SCA03_36460 [Streptomyces cacaoi]|uniref:Uncharacterized protein n=1 Tax=Streptomyces cacaoi TaxID=1898 RepID=A0A4Y3R094_STRCI|nr:hypothetical protein SCA03_36460 [Streptomyces cacaoi]